MNRRKEKCCPVTGRVKERPVSLLKGQFGILEIGSHFLVNQSLSDVWTLFFFLNKIYPVLSVAEFAGAKVSTSR